MREEIEERWEDLSAIRSGEPSKQDDYLAIYRSFGWFLGIFAVLVGGLGMMNTTLMSVSERTREIGVLRALGGGNYHIIGMIVGESLVLSLIAVHRYRTWYRPDTAHEALAGDRDSADRYSEAGNVRASLIDRTTVGRGR